MMLPGGERGLDTDPCHGLVLPYALATRCPVLTYRMRYDASAFVRAAHCPVLTLVYELRYQPTRALRDVRLWPYQVPPVLALSPRGISLRAPYAMSGTDIVYAATMSGTDVVYATTRSGTDAAYPLRNVRC
eukprot:1190842-Rhodomonas_salina.2